MLCHEINKLLPDYLTGTISESERFAVESHLSSCPECRSEADTITTVWSRIGVLGEEEPSPGFRAAFYARLEDETRDLEKRGSRGFFSRLSWSGQAGLRPSLLQTLIPALCLLVGVIIGHLLTQRVGNGPEVSGLRTELQQMKSMVALSLLDQQQSASERLRGVAWGSRLDQADDKVLQALVNTLNSDPSVNVRLAAVDALQRYSEQPQVRQNLVGSLSRQESPMVQLALIQAVVDLREKDSVQVLRQIAADDRANQVVRERARWGLQQLL